MTFLHFDNLFDVCSWIIISHMALRVPEYALMILPPVRASLVLAETELLNGLDHGELLAWLAGEHRRSNRCPLHECEILCAGTRSNCRLISYVSIPSSQQLTKEAGNSIIDWCKKRISACWVKRWRRARKSLIRPNMREHLDSVNSQVWSPEGRGPSSLPLL